MLVLDEFTNALDKRTCLQIYDFFNEYVAKNEIVVVNITHNMSDVEYMTGMHFLLENKKIVANLLKSAILDAYIKG